jgi:orotidine-5'-phosphate decarboxylase
LRRLGAEQFYEIPDSVSCFAGLIADRTGLPYLTLREKAKEGRVAKADYIGEAAPGERVAGTDDVITDGVSKAAPYFKCLAMGLNVLPFVVLVDRQQGWKKKFRELGIDVGVWPGMTLHDVRRFLIMNGLMERCSAQAEANNRMIVAVDGQKDWEDVLALVDPLRTTGSIIKVNDVLFNLGIRDLLPKLQVYGRVTVRNITKHLLPCPPWAMTVHASGNSDMVKAAVETLKGTPTKVLAVTVLTSLKPGLNGTCEEVYRRQPLTAVKGLAKLAIRGGADGFVCSPEETPMLRGLYPQSIIVNPGTRSPGVDKHDQARVDTPANALKRGANFFVSGRQVLNAPNPVLEVLRVHRDELHIDLGI